MNDVRGGAERAGAEQSDADRRGTPSLKESFVRLSFESAGFAPNVLAAYRRLLREAHSVLDDSGIPADGRRAWIVPGRIEVLGKHVDYAGGRSLLCSVQRGIVVVARRRDDRTLTMRDARRRETLSIAFDDPTTASFPWSVYPLTVLQRLRMNFGDTVCGADIALASNLPPAAGVSSSSALTVGLTLALSALSDLAERPEWLASIPDRPSLAGYVGALENGIAFRDLPGERGVGTMGGAQDQTAILCCAPGQLDVFAWSPVRHERTVPWTHGFSFVIGVSGVVAAKTGAAKERYNRAARTAQRLLEAWNRVGSGEARSLAEAFTESAGTAWPTAIPAALIEAAEVAANGEFTAAHLGARLQQFFDESYRFVPAAADALARHALVEFGEVVAGSQHGAERALENQIAETISLVRIAREQGAVAASAFGAGFGGSVWAMVRTSQVDSFTAHWRELYTAAHRTASRRAQFFVTEPGAPAFELIGD